MNEIVANFTNRVIQHIPSLKAIMWPVFILVCVVYVVISLVLVYHWRRYSLQNRRIVFAETLYFIGSLSILGVTLFALTFL